MALIGGAGGDPLFEEIDLGGGESVVSGIGGRHAEAFVVGRDALENEAAIWGSGDESEAAVAEVGFGGILEVEPEFRFAIARVRSVAGEATVGEDGFDVASEVDGGQCRGGEREQDDQSRHAVQEFSV